MLGLSELSRKARIKKSNKINKKNLNRNFKN